MHSLAVSRRAVGPQASEAIPVQMHSGQQQKPPKQTLFSEPWSNCMVRVGVPDCQADCEAVPCRYNAPQKGYVGPVTSCTETYGLVPETANGIHYEWNDTSRTYRCTPCCPPLIAGASRAQLPLFQSTVAAGLPSWFARQHPA